MFRRIVLPYDSEASDDEIENECNDDIHVAGEVMLVTENEHATGIGHTKTRKRKRNELAWKRNKKKHARLEGRAYTATNGRHIPAKHPKV